MTNMALFLIILAILSFISLMALAYSRTAKIERDLRAMVDDLENIVGQLETKEQE